MPTQNLIFEDDFETEDFKARNTVQFTYRNQVFKVKRRTLQDLLDDAERARTNPQKQTTFENWLENNLTTADYERFWTLFNNPNNPGRLGTIGKIIKAVEEELAAVGDDDDTPKE